MSEDSGRQKRTRFDTPAAPSEVTAKNTCGSPITAAQDHVNSHAETLHDKLAKLVVRCAANFMTRRQNLHYKIASQNKLKSDIEYIPKSAQIKLELYIEKRTKEGEDFQALQEKYLQVLADCQLKLKSLVIEAGDNDLVEKNNLPIVSFVESIHDISKGFLTYDDRHDITTHQCSVDVIELYSDHIAVHLIVSNERLLVECQKRYEPKEMPTARVTRPQATVTRLSLQLINLPPQKLLESRPGAFLTKEQPPHIHATLPQWKCPQDLKQESNLPGPTHI